MYDDDDDDVVDRRPSVIKTDSWSQWWKILIIMIDKWKYLLLTGKFYENLTSYVRAPFILTSIIIVVADTTDSRRKRS